MRGFICQLVRLLHGGDQHTARGRRALVLEGLEDRTLLATGALQGLPQTLSAVALQAQFRLADLQAIPNLGPLLSASSFQAAAASGGRGVAAARLGRAAPVALVLVADFNRDGRADLAVNVGSGTWIGLSQPDGSFRALPDLARISGSGVPVGLAVGDFNGDGQLDLLSVSRSSNGTLVSLLAGNADGTFSPLSDALYGADASGTAFARFAALGRAELIAWAPAAVQAGRAWELALQDERIFLAMSNRDWLPSREEESSLQGTVVPLGLPTEPKPQSGTAAEAGQMPASATVPDDSPWLGEAVVVANSEWLRADVVSADAEGKDQAESATTASGHSPAIFALHRSYQPIDSEDVDVAPIVTRSAEANAPLPSAQVEAPPEPHRPVAVVPLILAAPGHVVVAKTDDDSAAGWQPLASLDTLPLLGFSRKEDTNGEPQWAAPRHEGEEHERTSVRFEELLAQAIYLANLRQALAASGGASSAEGLAGPTDSRLLLADFAQRAAEGMTRLVRGFYAVFLGRVPANGEEEGWVGLLLAGRTQEDVLGAFLGTTEFAGRANELVTQGTPNERFVQSLFRLLLGRGATDEELGSHAAAINSLGRGGVASLLLRSTEYRTLQVETYCQDLLGRPAAPDEAAAWAESPFDLLTIRAALEAAAEVDSL